MNDPYDKLIEAKQAVDSAAKRYLKSCGWTYTCNTPGSFWLWTKTLPDGRIVLLSMGEAVAMAEVMAK